MIRITQQDSASGAKRYYATADYYSEGQEIVGLWGGKGASRLGLEGTVDKTSFERLCDNLHPATGEPLTVRTRWDRTVGYDFTFSVPKSVSLLYAMTGDPEILAAFRGAVDENSAMISRPKRLPRALVGLGFSFYLPAARRLLAGMPTSILPVVWPLVQRARPHRQNLLPQL